MQSAVHSIEGEPSSSLPQTSAIAEQLEVTRALIEIRFSDAGGQLAGSLDIVGRLIESLDNLSVALDAESVSQTTRDLLSTVDSLKALPKAQADRVSQLNRLLTSSTVLREHIEEMRQTLRYLGAFALNVKITAGATTRSSDEFAGFAEHMRGQIDLGGVQLNEFIAHLDTLDAQLVTALEFERELGGQYEALLPAVPNRLAVDAAAIGVHHARIADVAASVAAVARDIQQKVARALTALQIGDITRQRIEHVQAGLDLVAQTQDAELPADQQQRLQRRLLHLLADQMADTACDFEAEAAKVIQNMAGMAGDTSRILVFQTLSGSADDGGGLRGLEASLGQARGLVGDMQAAMANAHKIGKNTASTVDTLTDKVGAVHSVKRDIQQIAINTSLRCGRLGEIGKPLNVIALELTAQAGQLETAADHTLKALNALAGVVTDRQADDAQTPDDETDGQRLDQATTRLRQAADVVERDLVGLTSQGETAAVSLAAAAEQLNLKEELGDALHTAAIALAEAAGPVVEDIDDIADALSQALQTIAKSYTMARERTIHQDHMPATTDMDDEAPAPAPEAAGEDELDALLF